METSKRGGARQGAGAPRLAPGQTTESVQVRLDPARKAKAMAIGGGSVARGVRAALDSFPTASSREVWACKIGGGIGELPQRADWPMRVAVADAYRRLTGNDATFLLSGWGAPLTNAEKEVIGDFPIASLPDTTSGE